MFAKCPCNNCSGHIEFDSQDVGHTIQCPHCGLETLLFIPQRPLDPLPPPVVPPPVSNLGTCADCGQTVSVHAEACPHCGASFRKKHGVSYYMVFGVISLLATVCILAIGYAFFTGAISGLRKVPPSPVGTTTLRSLLPDITLDGEIFIATKGGENFKLGLVAVGLISQDVLELHLAAKKEVAKQEIARLETLLDSPRKDWLSASNARYAAFNEARRYADKVVTNDAVTLMLEFHFPPSSLPYGKKLIARIEAANWAKRSAREKQTAIQENELSYTSGDFYFADLPPAVKVAKSNADGKFQMQVPAEGRFALVARAQREVGAKVEKYFWAVKLNTAGKNRIPIMLSNDNTTSSESSDSLIKTTSD